MTTDIQAVREYLGDARETLREAAEIQATMLDTMPDSESGSPIATMAGLTLATVENLLSAVQRIAEIVDVISAKTT